MTDNATNQKLTAVRVWEAPLTIPTYEPAPPEKNPMFFEKRHNQGASGKVYPYPITEGVSAESVDHEYTAVYIENEYVQLIILPELGGRIYVAQDKTNGYDFIYRNQVIKPALIGLFGSWISGGIEFNWPLHHRPSTFMPVDYTIEEGEDGSKTVWLGEHDAFDRNKGMVGISLRPGSSLVEARVKLFNRTPLPQNFLWWANVGVAVNDYYQIIFPPDVYCVNDHGKRAMASWPIHSGKYGVYHVFEFPENTDISWYKNFTPAGSCFVNKSNMDFMAGYDHGKDAGIVYIANHHISPGKKFFTWGTTKHAKAWEYNLTDEDGPYIELMAGCYTDNQPDFSWIQPYETKEFSQYWYPIHTIGYVKNANHDVAVNLQLIDRKAKVGVAVSRPFDALTIELCDGTTPICETTEKIDPANPFMAEVDCAVSNPTVIVRNGDVELIRYTPIILENTILPEPLTEPPNPLNVESVDELFLIGQHLHQYRQDARTPESYWEEALHRDPGEARTNNAMGLLAYRRCDIEKAEQHFRAAIARLQRWNLNPYDSEAIYNLGLTLAVQGRYEEAYASFYKAVWSYAQRSASYYALAQIDCINGGFENALKHLDLSLETNQRNAKAITLKAVVLRKQGLFIEAEALLKGVIEADKLDFWAQFELAHIFQAMGDETGAAHIFKTVNGLMRGMPETYIDIAFDYGNAGFYEEALSVLAEGEKYCGDAPMTAYAYGYFLQKLGRDAEALTYYQQAETRNPDYCFPAQLHEMLILRAAIRLLPTSAKACYYLGNLMYDKRQHDKAVALWEKSAKQDAEFGMVWRNLGIAYFNREHDLEKALACYERAHPLDGNNARTFYEFDQLLQRKNLSVDERKAYYAANADLIGKRQDLYLENVKFMVLDGDYETAQEKMLSYGFSPWENGEGRVSAVYESLYLLRGKKAMDAGDVDTAVKEYETGLVYPKNLGEDKTAIKLEAMYNYHLGMALKTAGKLDDAKAAFEKAASERQALDVEGLFQAMAMRELGRETEATERLNWMLDTAIEEGRRNVMSGFSQSHSSLFRLPTDPQVAHEINMDWIIGAARIGLGDTERAKAIYESILARDANHYPTLVWKALGLW